TDDAISYMKQAITILEETGLPQDATRQTVEELREFLQTMCTEAEANGPSTMSSEYIQMFISPTISVMTTMRNQRTKWRDSIEIVLHSAQQQGADWKI